MPNKSHFNSALRSINKMNRENIKHASSIDFKVPEQTNHIHLIADCMDVLKSLPDNSIHLIILILQIGILMKIILNGLVNGLTKHIEFYLQQEVVSFLAVHNSKM